ncbi:MAG: tRNA pseudouridine synthase [Acidobacteria bacterium]|nr:tRNA pseudouridine synthase [Acidobacteriota bacterium]
MRLLLTLQYLGTRYAGWQRQTNAVGVQQVVEGALTALYGSEVRIEGAGRTDSGVHALAQRAHADVPFAIPSRGVLQGVNQRLPHDIRVTNVEEVADDFHCRFTARRKTYSYRIWNAAIEDVFRQETHAFVPGPLDAGTMEAAAQQLAGTHDFLPFTVASPEVSSTVRTVEAISVVREGDRVTITVTADGFLRYMVRRIAGSLIEIGRGKLDPERLWEVARWTAPAKGLVLVGIAYSTSANIPASR